MFSLLLKVLAAYTLASKTSLLEEAHTQSCVAMATPEVATSLATAQALRQERDELCVALTAAQESAVVQLLLEICLPNEKDKVRVACMAVVLCPRSCFGPSVIPS